MSAAAPVTPWRLLRDLLRPHRRALGGYGAVLSVATALPLAGSLLLARFVSLAVDGAPAGRLAPFAVAYATIGLVGSVVTVVVTWRATTLAWRITDRLRHDLARRVLAADLAFHRDRTPGELVTRVDADVTAMTQFLSQVVARVIAIAALAVASIGVAAVVVPRLAPVLAVGLGAIAWVTWAQRNSANAATVAERRAEAEVMSIAEQYLAGAEDVAALGAGAHGVGRIAHASDTLVRAVGRRVKVQMRVQGSIRVMIVAAEVAVVGAGALLLRQGWLSLAGVFLGYRLVAAVRQPVEGLTWRLQEAQGASGAAGRVLELLAEAHQLPDGHERLPPGPLDIRFEGVELVYRDRVADGPGARAAVGHLDLVVGAGRVVGVVGRTGSGKTSLARLVLRLVPPTAGRVCIGGVDLADVADADLRRRVAAVPQDVQLFPASVADNVSLFAPAEPGAVVAALAEVGLGPWLADLIDGVDTVIDPAGRSDHPGRAGLSGGQAQLLALARALLRQPDVVVLDEATSRIDPDTQAAIAHATDRLVAGRTALIVAHHLDTLSRCDDIAVMADGYIVEFGPRALLAADPASHYAQLLQGARP